MDRFQDLAVIKLSRFEGDVPTQLNAIQSKLMPYLPSLELLWWSLWWSILGYLVIRFIVLPLIGAEMVHPAPPYPSATMIDTSHQEPQSS